MKYTLLKLVQNYLDRTSGFYVDSIFDTDESLQLASIAEDVFYDLYTRFNDTEFSSKIRTCGAVSDTDKPNYLRIPSSVQRVHQSKVYYDIKDSSSELLNYQEVKYLAPHEFLDMVSKNIKTDASNYIIVQDYDRTKFPVQTDKQPQYCTSFDGEYLVFDSIDKSQDSTLQESKSRIYSSEEPVWLLQDDHIPDLPSHLFPLYRDLFLVEAYDAVYQSPAPTSVQRRANSGMLKLQQDNNRIGSTGRARINYARTV